MIFSKYSTAPSTNPHFVSMRITNDLIIASRLYIAITILFLIYLFWLRTLERCALIATALQFYRTFPDHVASFFEILLVSFRAALWITLVDYCGEDNCKTFYESDLVGLCRLRCCNCLRSGLYFTQGEEIFACTDRYRVHGLRNRQAPGLRFEVGMSPEASREMGPLRDYLNVLRSRAGEGVVVVFDEDSAFTEECQNVFKEITRLMRFDERYLELLAPRKRELLLPVRVWDKGVILPGAWIMCTRDYILVFQDLDAEESLCEIMSKSGKKMYRSIFASRLAELERVLPGLLCVVRLEKFGLVSSGWFFWGMNILHSSSFDDLFKYLLSGREVFVTRLSGGGQSTLVLGRKPEFLPAWLEAKPCSDLAEEVTY